MTLAPEAIPEPQPRSWAARALWALVGLFIVNWSVTLLATASYYPLISVIMVLVGLWGIGVVIGSLLDLSAYPRAQRAEPYLAWGNAIIMAGLIGLWAHLQLRLTPGFGTDELAFDQYAAQLMSHGSNPYLHSMGPAFQVFKLNPNQYTYTTAGKEVLAISYPSLSFLLYVPFILLGWSNQVALSIDVAAWVLTVLLLFKLLPTEMRAVALVIGCVSVYLGTVTGGDTDALYVPLLLLAAYHWDRFGEGRRTYLGPLALGLAMAVKQTPWPILLFVLCALILDEFDRSELGPALRRGARYLGAVAVGFVVPNLPFMVLSPSAWARGVLTPFTSNLVPSGQGIIALTLFDHLGGGSLGAFTITMLLVGVLVLVIYVGTYPLLRPGTFLLAAIVYMFASRSQTNYLIEFIPVVIVGAATVRPAGLTRALPELRGAGSGAGRWIALALERRPNVAAPLRSRGWALAIAGTAALSVASTAYALTDPSPLTLRITGINTTGYLSGIDKLTVQVRNRTDHTVRPHYTVQTSHGDTTFWNVAQGPKRIPGGQTVVVELDAPNYQAEPGTTDGFSVLAFTQSPTAVSVSHRYLRTLLHTLMYPIAFNRAIAVGHAIYIHVQLVDHLDDPVRRRGVAVYMTQLEYTSLGVRRSVAEINGNKTGRYGVVNTNSEGVATFRIVGTKASTVPVAFSSHLLDKAADYVYGSGGDLDVTFVG